MRRVALAGPCSGGSGRETDGEECARSRVVCKTDDIREWFIMRTCMYVFFPSPPAKIREGKWGGEERGSRGTVNARVLLSRRKNACSAPRSHHGAQPLGTRLRHYYFFFSSLSLFIYYHNEIDEIHQVFFVPHFLRVHILTWFLRAWYFTRDTHRTRPKPREMVQKPWTKSLLFASSLMLAESKSRRVAVKN